MAETAHPKRRWLRVTPGWLPVVLLVVEGFLLLSQRFHWFAFNEHKGWTVLIAVATAGVAMLLTVLWLVAALVFRLRFQFSIRSVLVLVAAVAIPCSWLAVEMKQAREQREAVGEIERLEGWVGYDYEFDASDDLVIGAEPRGPAWLRHLLGKDFFANVVNVDLNFTQVTDDGLKRVEELSQLQVLQLMVTEVTDTGLEHLKGLTQLRVLYLDGNYITDAGLEHLKGLAQLDTLGLGSAKRNFVYVGTNVTDAGVQKLQQALPNCYIYH
jgi:hypothetical protein